MKGSMREELDRALEPLKFDSAMRERVRARAFAAPAAAGPRRRLTRRTVVAVGVCAALIVTALAVGPTLWGRLEAHLGGFAPYAQVLEGTVTADGIEVQVMRALTDGYSVQVYYSITDVAGDRLSGQTKVEAILDGESLGAGAFGTRVLDYDPEGKTLLILAEADGLDCSAPMALQVSRISPGHHYLADDGPAPASFAQQESVTLSDGTVVLAPGQDGRALPQSGGAASVSAVGLATDGLLHVRIRVEAGCDGSSLLVMPQSKAAPEGAAYQEGCVITPVEDGYDYRFPYVTAAQMADVSGIYVYGPVQDTQPDLAGPWRIPLALEQVEQRAMEVGRDCGGYAVERVLVSPLGVTVFYRVPAGGNIFTDDRQAAVTLADGTAPAMTLSFSGRAVDDGSYSVWRFREPVELGEITSVMVAGTEVWKP